MRDGNYELEAPGRETVHGIYAPTHMMLCLLSGCFRVQGTNTVKLLVLCKEARVPAAAQLESVKGPTVRINSNSLSILRTLNFEV